MGSDKLNKYLTLSYTKRSGWIKRKLPVSESIFDHMYSCFLIGLVLLPNESKEYVNYNKNKILNLLLIHDLGEADIGDIIHGNKNEKDHLQERESIANFLNGVSFNDDTDYLSLWTTMETNSSSDINCMLVKEIDALQGAYQYFKFYVEGKVNWNSKQEALKESEDWFKCISNDIIISSIGRSIRDELIINNPLFKNHSALLDDIFKKLSNQFCI